MLHNVLEKRLVPKSTTNFREHNPVVSLRVVFNRFIVGSQVLPDAPMFALQLVLQLSEPLRRGLVQTLVEDVVVWSAAGVYFGPVQRTVVDLGPARVSPEYVAVDFGGEKRVGKQVVFFLGYHFFWFSLLDFGLLLRNQLLRVLEDRAGDVALAV